MRGTPDVPAAATLRKRPTLDDLTLLTIKAGYIGLGALWVTFGVTVVRPLWLGGNADSIVGVLAVSLTVVLACASGVR